MLFVILVICLAIGIIGAIECWDEWCIGPFAVGFLGVGVSLCLLIINYVGLDGYIAKRNIRHDMLVYQYENEFYENDNDVGKRDLIKDIQEWNEWLACNQEDQDDFWIGIYIPNIYDQFEFIELKGD